MRDMDAKATGAALSTSAPGAARLVAPALNYWQLHASRCLAGASAASFPERLRRIWAHRAGSIFGRRKSANLSASAQSEDWQPECCV